MLKGSKTKGRTQINWTREQETALKKCKSSLGRAMELAHPDLTAELILTTDANAVLGAVIEQASRKRAQPLTFLSKKLSQFQQKYSPYD